MVPPMPPRTPLPRGDQLTPPRAPTNHNLPPGHPPRTPPSQVLALGNQTLVNRAGQQGDAVVADLITEVLVT